MLKLNVLQPQNIEYHPRTTPEFSFPISLKNTKKVFENCEDFCERAIFVGPSRVLLSLCWLDGTVNGESIADTILRPLTDPSRFDGATSPAAITKKILTGGVYAGQATKTESMDELASALSFGHCAIIFDGMALLFEARTSQHRSVQEPGVEKSVKGSKDAFVEPLRVNTGLIRSRLRTPRLKLAQTVIGRKTNTNVSVLWLEGVAAPDLPSAMLYRLDNYDVDGAVLPDLIESALCDAPHSPFPQLIHTERPDKFVSCLLDGRIGILIDGIPIGYLAPVTLPDFMRTNEDLALHYLTASAIRMIRWAALAISLFLPAFYVALSMYHTEMIPLKLLLSVIDSKQYVPFSTAMEILGMLIAFELLQEAGLHLPDPVGQTVSIIGALIVGQSAVEARVISPIAVIVVALAGISGYTLPSQDLGAAVRLCRFGLVIAAAFAGMFGIVVGSALLLWHLCTIESFGRAYIGSAAEGNAVGSRAIFFRRPPWKDIYRDPAVTGEDKRMRR